MKYSNQSLVIVKSVVVCRAMSDKSVSHGCGAQTSDCVPAHGACALCITKDAIWRKNGHDLELGRIRVNSDSALASMESILLIEFSRYSICHLK